MADKSKYRWLGFIPRIISWFLPSFAAPLGAASDGIDGLADNEEAEFRRSESIGTAAGRAAKASSEATRAQ